MSPEISERSFEEAIECGAAPARPGRLRGRRDGGPRDAAAVRRHAAGRLPQAQAGGLRPHALPAAARRAWTSSSPRSRRSGRSSTQHHGAAVQEQFLQAPRRRDRAARRARRAAERHQGLGLQVPARLLPARERAQRGDAAAARGEPLRRGAPGPLQREEREEPRPGALPERHPDLHRRAQEPAQRPGRRGRDPPVQDRPRPARAAPRLRPLPRALRGGPGPGLRHHPARRAEDALPALQPGQVRRRRQPARAAHAQGLRDRLPVGGDLGARQRARPRAPVHPRGRGGRREGAQDRQALPDLPALPAARLRAAGSWPTRARRARDSAT